MPDIDLSKFWETLKSSGAQTSLLVALLGQATAGLVFQVTNNEQQQAAIIANRVALQEWKDADAALNTAFGQKFVKLEDTVNDAIRRSEALQSPIGQRFILLESRAIEAINIGTERARQIDRLAEQVSQMNDRFIGMERRVQEIELKLSKPQEKQP